MQYSDPRLEQDKLIWHPSLTLEFTVKSTHRLITRQHIRTTFHDTTKVWKLLWKAKLHGRHTLFIWKMSQNVLPTLDRLHKFLPNVNLDYLICGDHPETIEHLVFECPLSKLLWWNSPHRSILWNEI